MLSPDSPQPTAVASVRAARFYQLSTIILLITFGYYIALTMNMNRAAEEEVIVVRRHGPFHSPSSGGTSAKKIPIDRLASGATNGLSLKDKLKSPTSTVAADDPSLQLLATVNIRSTSSSDSSFVPTRTYTSLPTIINQTDYRQFIRATYPPVGPERGSIHDPSYLNTPIAYGTPLVPVKVNDGFPTGSVLRPACQMDTDILQDYLYANQHPADCSTKRLYVRRTQPQNGLFSCLVHSSSHLFVASLLGRTLIDFTSNPYFAGNCPTNDLRCAFLPITNCTEANFNETDICYDKSCYDTARVISLDNELFSDFCPPQEFAKENCNHPDRGATITNNLSEILPTLKTPHGEQFLQAEYFRYLTRPNQRLTDYAANEMKQLNLTDQLIAVHVRHGDKVEGIQFPTRAYSVVVKRAIQITGIRTVFIGSDDRSVFEELPRWVDLPNVRYAWLNPDLNPIVFNVWQASDFGNNTIGLQMLTQTIINTQAQVFIGTRSSILGQIVYAMQGNDCSRQKIAYDMYGDLFYNSWYCRGDIVHAGREWMCALKPPVNGSMIHEWGGSKTECWEDRPGAR